MVSYLDKDVKFVGIELARQPIKYHNAEAQEEALLR